jgi:methylmalonyl-CoA/ethylmalonyl-CoA epimerase
MVPVIPKTGLATIGQVGITVTDIGRAVAFYRDVLGLRFLFQAPNMAFFDCGGVRLMLAPDVKHESSHPVIYFRVGDIQSATEALQTRCVTFEREPYLVAKMFDHDLWMALFRDPDENLLAIMCEKARHGG